MFLCVRNSISVVLVFVLVALAPCRGLNFGQSGQQGEQISSLVQAGMEAKNQGQFEKAYEDFKTAYSSGDDLGEVFLGMAYMKGEGVQQDANRAKKYFESVLRKHKREEKFNSLPVATAFFGLAQLYENGLGVHKELGKAFHYYKDIIFYNGGAWRLNWLQILSYAAIVFFPLAYIKHIRLKNLRVAAFANAPVRRGLIAQTLYKMGMIYQKRGNTSKAKKFLDKAVDFGNEDAIKVLQAMGR